MGITGFTQINATTWEYLSIDYSQSAGTLGTATHTSIGGTIIDRINATTFDASGNVYITGAMSTGSNGLDIKTVKLDASLNILWTATYDGSAHKDDVGRGIAVDGSGNVYVAGYTSGANDKDATLIKYSSAGSQSWAQTYDGAEGDDAFADLAITSDTKIFVGGYTTQKGNRDFYTALYTVRAAQKPGRIARMGLRTATTKSSRWCRMGWGTLLFRVPVCKARPPRM